MMTEVQIFFRAEFVSRFLLLLHPRKLSCNEHIDHTVKNRKVKGIEKAKGKGWPSVFICQDSEKEVANNSYPYLPLGFSLSKVNIFFFHSDNLCSTSSRDLLKGEYLDSYLATILSVPSQVVSHTNFIFFFFNCLPPTITA